jgi:hypothetical protein
VAVQTANPAPRPVSPDEKSPVVQRTDNWWSGTLFFFVIFSLFGAWATFRAFQNDFYNTLGSTISGGAHYLSPFYSPTFQLGRFGIHFGRFNISPALIILPFPLSFRLSCYYYRKMLYRSYLADPLGCAVKEPAPLGSMRYKKYRGERAFPLRVQNFHRYAFFAAVVFIVLLWKDTFDAFFFTGADGVTHIGMGLGTLVFLVNICLLTLYTFSCHSWRHFVGGGADCYSCTLMSRTRHGLWSKVSYLNERHGLFAMASLISVAVTDVVVWLIASGRLHDIRFF